MRTLASFCRKFASWTIIILFSLCTQPPAPADVTFSPVLIDITDTSGALVPDASVVIRNVETIQEQRARSGKSGSVTFLFLKPGHYKLVVTKSGFAEVSVDNILLNV